MNLTAIGESRVNGYLFVLERALKTFLPHEVVRDAVREIESHLRERIAAADGLPDERRVVERILEELGPPLRVAQAYSTERTIDEAVATGRIVPMTRAVWHLAVNTLIGSAVATALFSAYATGVAFIIVGLLKPIFPNNVGLLVVDGVPRSFGAQFPPPAGGTFQGGYWIIPLSIACGVAVLVLAHKAARRYLSSFRKRRPPEL
jgi:uncharacterized membrane protein